MNTVVVRYSGQNSQGWYGVLCLRQFGQILVRYIDQTGRAGFLTPYFGTREQVDFLLTQYDPSTDQNNQ